MLERRWYGIPDNDIVIYKELPEMITLIKGLSRNKTYIVSNVSLMSPILKIIKRKKIIEMFNTIAQIKYLSLNHLLLYGGAITINDDIGVAILGMSGVGKTTLIRSLLARYQDIRYLADDAFLINDKLNIYSYPTIYYNDFRNKIALKLAPIRILFFLEKHDGAMKILPLDSDVVLRKLKIIQNIRFPLEYNELILIYKYMHNETRRLDKLIELRNKFLTMISHNTQSYIIKFSKISDIVEKFSKIINRVLQ